MVNRTYVLRDIHDALWREVKAQAAERGVTIREALLDLLQRWVRGRSVK